MNIAAVVLHYRFWPGLRPTLDALLSQSRPPGRVVVVDNHSDDGSVPQIRDAYPGVEVLEAPENRGYGPGMNLGIAAVLGDQPDGVLVLTHECQLGDRALERLANRLDEDSGVGAVGPLLGYVTSPDRVWSAGGMIDRRTWHPVHLGTSEPLEVWQSANPYPVDWLDGCCLLLRTEALRDAGRFDERFFLYFEDTEYLLRLGRLGWRVECVPTALAHQEPGAMSSYLKERNRLGLIRATAPTRYLAREIASALYRMAVGAVRPNSAASGRPSPDGRALLDFLLGRWGPPTRA